MVTKIIDVASKGGLARAQSLSASKRSEIAANAAARRWGTPRALRAATIKIADIELECAVLDDEGNTRVISETRFMAALGMYRSGALSNRRAKAEGGSAKEPLFLAYKNLKPFIQKHLGPEHFEPIPYVTPEGGLATTGIRATVLPKICEVWIDADRAGVLGHRQELIAAKADVLFRGFAHVGLIALIDEATGFQDDRARDALAQILEAFVAKELQPWVKTFPIDYYKEMCRLRSVPYSPSMKLPQYFGHLTNDVVYARLAPRVLEEIQGKNPVVKTATSKKGYRKNKNFQWLTEDIGSPKLNQHLSNVVVLMKASPDGGWDTFKTLIDKALPTYSDLPLIRMIEDGEEGQ
jgi:hypothetical protein